MSTTVISRDSQIKSLSLPPEAEQAYHPAGGGLYLRLRRGRRGEVSRAWVYRYSVDGSDRRMSLGAWPAVTLSDARQAQLDAERLRAGGRDPLVVRQQQEVARRFEQAADKPRTVAQLFEKWLSAYAAVNHKDKGYDSRAAFRNHIQPALGRVQLSMLRAGHITTLLDRIYAQGKRRTCGVVLRHLKQVIAWGLERELVERDVTAGIKAKSWGGKGQIRTRHLSLAEIKELSPRIDRCTLNPRWKHAIWLVLACGTRVGETLRTKREHIDLEARTWLIPAENQKQVNRNEPQQDHVIHLSSFALKHVRALLDIGGEVYLFPKRQATGKDEAHAREETLTHAIENHLVDAAKRKQLKKTARKLDDALLLSGGSWSTHDLRRTFATGAGELGHRPDIIDRCLNHVPGGVLQTTYQRQELRKHMKEAWDSWGNELERLVSEAKAEVSSC